MKEKLLVGALAMLLVLVFIATVPVAAETDPGLQAFLSRLNGSRWVGYDKQDGKRYLELQGDTIAQYTYYRVAAHLPYNRVAVPGTTVQNWGVRLQGRRFTYSAGEWAAVFEISEDGLIITQEDVRTYEGLALGVTKWIKEN
ncbi:MAG: hypothetical protein ABSD38_12250 [Syntrophorhabdales bacterium]|jgi:hypothetical protein